MWLVHTLKPTFCLEGASWYWSAIANTSIIARPAYTGPKLNLRTIFTPRDYPTSWDVAESPKFATTQYIMGGKAHLPFPFYAGMCPHIPASMRGEYYSARAEAVVRQGDFFVHVEVPP